MDHRFCPICSGIIEAGGDSECTCEDEGDRIDRIYDEERDRRMMESVHAHELINRGGL